MKARADTAHAKLSASSAHRWTKCAASVRMEQKSPDQPSAAALEGAIAHHLAEACLTSGKDSAELFGDLKKLYPEVNIADEMVEHVQEYLYYVRDMSDDLLIEQRVDFSKYVPGGFGTADVIAMPGGVLHVVDFKYGRVGVSAEDNPQLLLYALGAIADFDFIFEFKKVNLCIHQPRIGNVSQSSYDREEVLSYGPVFEEAAYKALEPDAEFNPGPTQCRNCKARAHCPALQDYVLNVYNVLHTGGDDVFENPEAVGRVLSKLDTVAKYVKEFRESARDSLLKGSEIPGFKVVKSRRNRQWVDEERVSEILRSYGFQHSNVFQNTLASPSQTQKILGKKSFRLVEDYVRVPEGYPTLVPDSDKRPAMRVSVEEEFKDFM